MNGLDEAAVVARQDLIAADPRAPWDVLVLAGHVQPYIEAAQDPRVSIDILPVPLPPRSASKTGTEDTAGGDHAAQDPSHHSRSSRAGSGAGHQPGTRKTAEPGGGGSTA